jgi:hypothetical protein
MSQDSQAMRKFTEAGQAYLVLTVIRAVWLANESRHHHEQLWDTHVCKGRALRFSRMEFPRILGFSLNSVG